MRAPIPRRQRAARSAAAQSGPRRRTRRSPAPSPASSRWWPYLDDDREDHGPAACAVVDELTDAIVDVLLEELDLADVLREQVVDDRLRLLPHLRHELVGLGEATGDQLWGSDAVARKGRDDDEHAVLGQVATVAQCDVRHVADAEAVDERHAAVHAIDDPRAGARQLDDVAVLGDHDPRRGNAGVPRESRVRREHAELAVDRHDGLWADEPEERPQLLPARVAGDVDGGV